MNLKMLAANLPQLYAARQSIMLIGAPGMGKTETVDQFGAAMSKRLGVPFAVCTMILSGMDPVDIRGIGIPMKASDGGFAEVRFSKPSVFPNKFNVEVYAQGEYRPQWDGPVPEFGVLFLDEWSQADIDVQKVAAQLILDRRLGEHVLPEKWWVIGAGNRVEDGAGVVKQLTHVQNRYCEIHLQPDYAAWEAWAHSAGVHPLTVSFAKHNAGQVFQDAVPKKKGPYCTPRSLVLCTNNLMHLRDEKAGELQLPDTEFAAEVVAGWIGEATMAPFMSHVRMGNDLPDPSQIIANPKTTPVPERLDAKFTIALAMAVHATSKELLKPILSYITRMDTELQVQFAVAVIGRNPQMLSTPEMSAWVSKHQELLVVSA